MEDGEPYIDPKFFGLVEEKMQIRSSVSIIHYFPVPPPASGETDGGVFIEEPGDGVNVPSAIHQGETDYQPTLKKEDTGIFTLILCSDVQGLEVQPHQHPPRF